MLYLFLTGKRAAYLNTIFVVLYLPEHTLYDLKYIDQEDYSIIDRASAGCMRNLKEERVLILFNNEKGLYIPLRMGILKDCVKADGQIYYTVELMQYCYTDSISELRHFIDLRSGYRIKYSQNDEVADGGVLAFADFNEREGIDSFIKENSDSWIETVHILEKQECFAQYYSVFTKLEILDKNKRKFGKKLEVVSDKAYIMRFTYYIPHFNDRPMKCIPVRFFETDKILGIINAQDILMSEQNKIDINILPSIEAGKRQNVQFYFEISDRIIDDKYVQYSKSPVKFTVKERIPKGMYYFGTIVCVFLLALVTYVSTLPYDSILTSMPKKSGGIVYWLCKHCKEWNGIQNVFCSGVFAVLTWILVKITGKPKL